jgi:hypothetical protein
MGHPGGTKERSGLDTHHGVERLELQLGGNEGEDEIRDRRDIECCENAVPRGTLERKQKCIEALESRVDAVASGGQQTCLLLAQTSDELVDAMISDLTDLAVCRSDSADQTGRNYENRAEDKSACRHAAWTPSLDEVSRRGRTESRRLGGRPPFLPLSSRHSTSSLVAVRRFEAKNSWTRSDVRYTRQSQFGPLLPSRTRRLLVGQCPPSYAHRQREITRLANRTAFHSSWQLDLGTARPCSRSVQAL